MNVGDAQWLQRALTARGLKEAFFVRGKECDNEDISIIYTCSVREKPEEKVYQLIQRLQFLHRHNPRYSIAVGGCVAQQLGATLLKKFPAVKIVFGTDAGSHILNAIDAVLQEPSTRICLDDFTDQYVERELVESMNATNTLSYVNIMQGCDNYCAYCIVPFTRGKQKSRTIDAILKECQYLLERGTKEIVLLGQNVNAYGFDNAAGTFAELLMRIGNLDGLERLSFMTPHPKDFDVATIQAFAVLPVLSPKVHLPVQSGSDTILQRMQRGYTSREYLTLVEALRSVRPDIVFSTDIIVGFPTETEEDFSQTLALLEAVQYVKSFSFCYSDRPNTVASTMEGKVPKEIALERLARLQAVQTDMRSQYLSQCIGTKRMVLCGERLMRQPDPEKDYWYSEDEYGNAVHIVLQKGCAPPAQCVEVIIVDANQHTLIATIA